MIRGASRSICHIRESRIYLGAVSPLTMIPDKLCVRSCKGISLIILGCSNFFFLNKNVVLFNIEKVRVEGPISEK